MLFAKSKSHDLVLDSVMVLCIQLKTIVLKKLKFDKCYSLTLIIQRISHQPNYLLLIYPHVTTTALISTMAVFQVQFVI